ncbi:Eukaryotic translation initiation factor 4 gamma 2 [Eumeta japonica]|uniref:Eukaryotic translation initiation factor 4 gamma 2 n=1 Tax=Eumeta variegata TaxID=151549 RepID=A0A4C1T1S0_EUMVA|nr:Eukaryotic translation initiation factor 4 gamma 2 [Eumeta japonica]
MGRLERGKQPRVQCASASGKGGGLARASTSRGARPTTRGRRTPHARGSLIPADPSSFVCDDTCLARFIAILTEGAGERRSASGLGERPARTADEASGSARVRTATKTESARQPGPVLRASGRTAAVPPARRRWVPPSSLRHHDVSDGDAKLDVIFRKVCASFLSLVPLMTFVRRSRRFVALQVRGILNKLTPEKFQKLSDDLLGLELDSDKVLKGVILLIFEKALDEPKYSSMYAQLCKRLSEEAPNLEPPGQPCTFKLLLLNKCRTEFENRAQAFAVYEERDGGKLSPDEEEKRHLAKCKMLGNIKFIGELGKLEILSESILHRCIQNLLARRAASDHHEDLECLAQLVKTCGRVLDSERGRGLMEQYFARMDTLSQSRDLAPRIRFMLRDVIELRRGGWVPRPALTGEGPVPIHQLRDDDDPRRDREPPLPQDPLFRHGLRPRHLDDMFSGLSLSATSTSLVPTPTDKLFGGNGFGQPTARDAYRQRSAPGYQRGQNNFKSGGGGAGSGGGGGGATGKETAPRFNKSRIAVGAAALSDVQMRPAANSLLFTANKLSKPQPTPLPLAPLPPSHQSVLPPTFASAPSIVKEAAITIKPAPDKAARPKKEKGITKDEACRLVVEAARAATAVLGETVHAPPPPPEDEPAALREQSARLRDLQLPDKLLRRAVAALLEHALTEPDASVWACCALVRDIKRAPALDALRALLSARHPHDRLPSLLAHSVLQKLVSLSEIGAWMEGGQYYPLLLETLQHLKELVGLERLQTIYNDSKLNLSACLPAGTSLAEAVEARGLAALVPQLRVQAELARQLAAEPAPTALYRWIKANVEPTVRHNAAFVSTLVALLAKHITTEALTVGAGANADKGALEREKAMVEAYAPLLTALVEGRAELQLAAVYAVQVHAHEHGYPKGLLLRWFMYLYNLEVCEEEAFLRWREDVTDAYPGKGEALFQVNAWLTWLQQQESDEDEAED